MDSAESVANKNWDGPGRYYLSDGLHKRQLGYCIYRVDLVQAVQAAYDIGFDLSDVLIVRIKANPAPGRKVCGDRH